MSENIVVATIHPWNINRYKNWQPPAGFVKHLITTKDELTAERLAELKPKYVFFPHWSWIIPKAVHEEFECVVFHMTDLPFGRGGSPLQNLLVRGVYETKISAIKVESGLDTGPIYMKRPCDLSEGSALQLFDNVSSVVFEMMTEILIENPVPLAQTGQPTLFERRKPEQSEVPAGLRGRAFYDFIRMLDAPGYPYAFIKNGDQVLYLTNATLLPDGSVSATMSTALPGSHS